MTRRKTLVDATDMSPGKNVQVQFERQPSNTPTNGGLSMYVILLYEYIMVLCVVGMQPKGLLLSQHKESLLFYPCVWQ